MNRAEVDEHLIAAGYTLLGAVYRRAGGGRCPTCGSTDGVGQRGCLDCAARPAPAAPADPPDEDDDYYNEVCPHCGGDGLAALRHERSCPRWCPSCNSSGRVGIGDGEDTACSRCVDGTVRR